MQKFCTLTVGTGATVYCLSTLLVNILKGCSDFRKNRAYGLSLSISQIMWLAVPVGVSSALPC